MVKKYLVLPYSDRKIRIFDAP